MQHPYYEKAAVFASEGPLAAELARARQEFEKRTGELFESDSNFEHRIAAFLEWYVLDRPLSDSPSEAPIHRYVQAHAENLDVAERTTLLTLTQTHLSLLEYRRVKGESLVLLDLLTNAKHEVFERRRPAGLAPGDILEARLVEMGEQWRLSETVGVVPRAARRHILRGAKRFRRETPDAPRIGFVHRVAFLANRCERYRHVDPREIFNDL